MADGLFWWCFHTFLDLDSAIYLAVNGTVTSHKSQVTRGGGGGKWLTVLIFDFWGPYKKLCRGEWMKRICPCFTLSRITLAEKRSRNSISFTARYAFNSSPARHCMTFTLHDLTDFYVERVKAHRIKINDYSCFHNRWPNSKTKLKLTHLWEQGVLVFRGPYAACVLCV